MDLDQIRGGPQDIRALMKLAGADGRAFINRLNLAAFGVMESSGTPPTFRVVTTRTTDSRKDEFAEIFKAGYFRAGGEHHLLVMYDWNISRAVMTEVIAPMLSELFDYAEGDLLTSALVEIVSTTERITKTKSALKWIQRLLSGDDPTAGVTKNEVSLHLSLLSLETRAGGQEKWRMRHVAGFINDFHVSPNGHLAVLSEARAFEVTPRVFVRAARSGFGGQDDDFVAARGLGVRVGPNAVLSRYTQPRLKFAIPVYDQGELKIYDPDSLKVLYSYPSDRFIMTSADGSGSLFALERTDRGRRKVTPERTNPSQDTLPLHAH